ncbi:MAG: hypothetical protein NTY80_04640 [candidate division SR1 bacterium]|nr:hypothetical protein [candidate division SR1 bacterium]
MPSINKLDTNYGATQGEKDYVKETLEKESVKELFKKEIDNLSTKIIRNFHSDNYVSFEVHKKFENEKQSMNTILKADPDMEKKYETALAKNTKRPGFSKGILLVQAIAIKCINKINAGESVENKLTSRNGTAFKSQAIDGILGPNTFYVLASIAKEKKISFNGMIDKRLLSEMIKICGEPGKNTDTKKDVPANTEAKKETSSTIIQPKIEDKKERTPAIIEPKAEPKKEIAPTVIEPKKNPTPLVIEPKNEPKKDTIPVVNEPKKEVIPVVIEPKVEPKKEMPIPKPIEKSNIDAISEKENTDFLKYKMILMRLKLKMNKKKAYFEYSTYDNAQAEISKDQQRKFFSIYKDSNKTEKLMDIGFFSAGENKGKVYVGLDDYIHGKSEKIQDLDLDNIVDKRDEIIEAMKVGKSNSIALQP